MSAEIKELKREPKIYYKLELVLDDSGLYEMLEAGANAYPYTITRLEAAKGNP